MTPRRYPPVSSLAHAWGLAALLASALLGGPAAAGEPTPLSLTISGGGTKGAYMAGHLFYTGTLARASGTYAPKVFTGASAGAMNSLLGVMSTCRDAELNPVETLYWESWTTVGLDELYQPDKIGPTNLLTSDAFAPMMTKLKGLWDAGLPEGCDVMLGVAIVRADARSVVVAPRLPPLPISRETVLVRITGQGRGKAPVVRNHVDAGSNLSQILLPLDGPNPDAFDAIAAAVIASGAYPIGFSPVDVPHCVLPADFRGGPRAAPQCTAEVAQHGLFIDGGLFDNQPLGLAMQAMTALENQERLAAARLSVDELSPPLPAVPEGRFYFLDPRVQMYPSTTVDSAEAATTPAGAGDVVRVMGEAMAQTRSRELLSVFLTEPAVVDRMLLAQTYMPQVSDTFSGLIDLKFRTFDFYLGMYNAARSERESAVGGPALELDALALADASPEMRAAWRPYQCLRALYDGVGSVAACEGEDLQDFRILAQVSLDRLGSTCQRAAAVLGVERARELSADHPACTAAIAGDPSPRVPGVRELAEGERRQRGGESELHHLLRLLGHYGFHFRDLGLDRDESSDAHDEVVRLAQHALNEFSDAQPRGQHTLAIASRIGVDMKLGYMPPAHSFHATLGMGAELAHSVTTRRGQWSWLRWSTALALDGLSTPLYPVSNYFAVIPKAGPELEVFGSPQLQVRLGTRAGYQLSSWDGFAGGQCDLALEERCSRFIAEGFVAGTLYGLVRLQLAVVIEPPLMTGHTLLYAIRPTGGFQLNSPF